MDMTYFERSVPVTQDIFVIVLTVGWALLLGNLVFQAMRSMAAGLGFEAEDPKLLFARTAVFSFLLLASRQICNIGLGITATVIDMLQVPSSVQIPMPEETTFSIGASWLLVLIIGFIVMWQVVRLFFEVGERYVVTAILTILSPLAFAMGGSKSTEDIFKGWVRMFGSMCLMMVFNVIFLKMLISVLAVMPSGTGVLPWMILVMGIARVARKIDSIIARIGLNPAITGDGLGRGGLPGMLAFTVVRSLGSTVAKTIGKNGGGCGVTGGGSHTPPGGAGGGGSGHTYGGRGPRAGRASSASYATSSQQSQSSTTAGTTAAQGAAQTSKAQAETHCTQQSDTHSRSATQTAAGRTAEQRPGTATAPGTAGGERMASTAGVPDGGRMAGTAGAPGTQRSSSRRTSTPMGRPGWTPRPSFVAKEAPTSAAGVPKRPGTAGTPMPGADPRQETPRRTDSSPHSTPTVKGGVMGTTSGTAGTQATAGTQRPEASRFTAVPPTARQESAGKLNGARAETARQSSVSMSKSDASTRQSSVSTQQTATESSRARSSTPAPAHQSRVPPGMAAPGAAGMPTDKAAERPARGGHAATPTGGTRPAPPAGATRTDARSGSEATRSTAPGTAAHSRPAPARQESRPASSAGAAGQTPRSLGGTAGTAQTAKTAEQSTCRSSPTASAPMGQPPVKPGGKRTTPGGQASPQQKNRPPQGMRGGKKDG